MKIIVNGEQKEFKENITISTLLKELNIQRVMAIAVNMQIIKEKNWDKYIIKEGDKIEMMTFVAGG